MADTLDTSMLIDKYLKLRNKIKEMNDAHDATLKPYKEGMELIENALLAHLQATNSDSVKVKGIGTASSTDKYSAVLEDPEAFRTWIVSQNEFDMADIKANVTNVREYQKQNAGALPPGVRLSSIRKISVRVAPASERSAS